MTLTETQHVAAKAAPLQFKTLDHVIRAVPDLQPAYEAIARLGINATPPGAAADTGNLNTFFSVGGLQNTVAIEYITVTPEHAHDPRNAEVAALVADGGGMYFIAFEIADLAPARAMFEPLGGYDEREISVPTPPAGETYDPMWDVLKAKPIRTLMPKDTQAAGCRFLILEYPPAVLAFRDDPTRNRHDFPLKRVDHVAVVPPDFEAATRYWSEVMGAERLLDIDLGGILMRQMKVGDVIVELLSPGPGSRMAGAKPGLRSMVAFEVDDLPAAVALARSRGFTVPDPAPGPIPRSIVSTIAPKETADLAFQLLQYV